MEALELEGLDHRGAVVGRRQQLGDPAGAEVLGHEGQRLSAGGRQHRSGWDEGEGGGVVGHGIKGRRGFNRGVWCAGTQVGRRRGQAAPSSANGRRFRLGSRAARSQVCLSAPAWRPHRAVETQQPRPETAAVPSDSGATPNQATLRCLLVG